MNFLPLHVGLALALACGLANGQTVIDQNRALAGSITPGDAPGFPIRLSLPGSYKLTGNLVVGTLNTNAIELAADGITLDLNGYTISGPISCTGGSVSAVNCSASSGLGRGITNIAPGVGESEGAVVRNGTVRGFFDSGIGLGAYSRIENVTAARNARSGLRAGLGSVIVNSVTSYNGGVGIYAIGSVVTGSTSNGNGDDGFTLSAGSVVSGSVSRGNAGAGVRSDSHSGVGTSVLSGNTQGPFMGAGSLGTNRCNGVAC
ncbi:hypothetical protein [Roseateles sp.]|uniref:hypothetical protein n=1 Tax=Roseateles sp. TaxID=1971397 RepID=UPI0039EBB4D6